MSQIPEIKSHVVITNSLSKTYAMTGWRVGYTVGDKKIISKMPEMQEGIASCVPGFIQKAAVDAINGLQDDTKRMLAHYSHHRDILIDGLNAIPGIKCIKSPATFYAFPSLGYSRRI